MSDKVDVDNICWIIGIVYHDGSIKSVIETLDQTTTESHRTLFGLHGKRWRADNQGLIDCNLTDLAEFTEDERFAIDDHLRGILGDNFHPWESEESDD